MSSVFTTTITPIIEQLVLKIQHLQHTFTTDAHLFSENLAGYREDTLQRRLHDSVINYH